MRDAAGVDSYEVPGLGEPVEIVQDRCGVPHIYAATRGDAFVAQGFNAARERLFQIDLWRRRGLGRLSAAFGPEHVEQDRATRLCKTSPTIQMFLPSRSVRRLPSSWPKRSSSV